MTAPHRIVTFGEAMIRLTPPVPRATRADDVAEPNVRRRGAECGGDRRLPRPRRRLGLGLAGYAARADRSSGPDARTGWTCPGPDPARIGRPHRGLLPGGRDRSAPVRRLLRPRRSAMAQLELRHVRLAGAAERARRRSWSPASHRRSAPAPGRRPCAAIRAANAARIPVFFDLNYRSKLWTEDEARACFVELAQRGRCHVCVPRRIGDLLRDRPARSITKSCSRRASALAWPRAY